MKSSSLVRRAVLLVLVAELLCALALTCAALLHERRTRLHSFDTMLQGRSDSLLGAIQDAEDPGDHVTVDPTELRLPADDLYAVYDASGQLVGASSQAPLSLLRKQGDGYRDLKVGARRYRAYERGALRIIDRDENGGQGFRRPVTIVYAAPLEHIWHEIFEGAAFYAAVSFLLLCLTGVLLILLLRRLLRPLAELAAEASGVTAASLKFESPATALRLRELRPLSEALSAAMARLRKSFEMEQQFIGDAAHELKTAVAVVRSSVQVLSMRQRSEQEYRIGLERIYSDNRRVEELLARMLTLAHLDERQEPEQTQDDLAGAVERTLGRVQSFAEAHEVALRPQLTRGLTVPISPQRAETLISNLVMNAVQHSPRGSAVCVAVKREDGGAAAVVLEVRDHGTGISPDALPHVFDRFFREDTSRSRDTGGAGLGLAICKSIADAVGAAIHVQSTPGVGTTVRVIFSRA